jgi:hypothetical protein
MVKKVAILVFDWQIINYSFLLLKNILKMLEISHEEIIFLSKQMKKSLMLTNNSESSIIFKVFAFIL